MGYLNRTKDSYGFPVTFGNLATSAPLSWDSAGEPGQWGVDSLYLYYCYAPNAWRRVSSVAFGTMGTIGTITARWIAQDLDVTLSNGADVLTWADNTGNLWTATNANSAGNRPTFVKPASGINNQDAVASTSTQTGFSMTNSSIAWSQGTKYTIVIVFKYTGSAPGSETGLFGIAGGNSNGMRTGMAGSNSWEYTVPNIGNFLTANSSVTDNVWHFMMMVLDQTATPKVSIYLDNPFTALSWSGSAPSTITTNASETGFTFGSSGIQKSNNQIAECVIYSSSLALFERQVVQRYCQTIYGFS